MTASARTPEHWKITHVLRAKVLKVTYSVGTRLLPTSQLMQYGVSVTGARATVKKLPNKSVNEGQLGKGVFVERHATPQNRAIMNAKASKYRR